MKRSMALAGLMLAAGGLLSAGAASACQQSGPPQIRLRVYSPLVAAQSGPSTDVSVDGSGCVVARFPSFDTRHGTHAFLLGGIELASLRAHLRDSGLQRIDAARLKRALQIEAKFAAPPVEHVVSDGDIIHLEFAAADGKAGSARPVSLQWSNLDADLRNHPYSRELKALDDARRRLIDLSTDRRLEVQP